jgi:hypothetical protein
LVKLHGGSWPAGVRAPAPILPPKKSGFARVKERLDDLILDVPNVQEKSEACGARETGRGLLLLSFTAAAGASSAGET